MLLEGTIIEAEHVNSTLNRQKLGMKGQSHDVQIDMHEQ